MARDSLTQERLKELLFYNPDTGNFTRKVALTSTVAVGDIAGSVMNTGYIEISVEGARWLGHRLAFLFMLGEVPRNVDHINRIKSDNRWENLRACTHKENMQNVNVRRTSLTGIRNVHKHKRSGLYFVSLRLNGKVTSFGYYKDIELAELVAIEARNKYFNIKE